MSTFQKNSKTCNSYECRSVSFLLDERASAVHSAAVQLLEMSGVRQRRPVERRYRSGLCRASEKSGRCIIQLAVKSVPFKFNFF